jgi:hypothetical protein
MNLDIAAVSPYITAFIVAIGALLVGALNQRHRTLEKRLDDLYSKIYPFVATKEKELFPKHGSTDSYVLLRYLFEKNYLMSNDLLYEYSGYVLPAYLKGEDAFVGHEDRFTQIVRRDYEEYRSQYQSFSKLLAGLFTKDKLSSPNHSKPP